MIRRASRNNCTMPCCCSANIATKVKSIPKILSVPLSILSLIPWDPCPNARPWPFWPPIFIGACFFQNALPEDATGVMIVLENTQDQVYTYRVDGQVATYIGPGDFHDAAYDDLGHAAHMASYIKQRSNPTTRSYTTVGLDDSYCDYTLRVYPSADTEAEYKTRKPIWYTLVVACIFLVTSAVFLLYDWWVERRQRLVMTQALQSGQLISSLFPENVRERLLQEAAAEHDKKSGNKWGDDVDNIWKTTADADANAKKGSSGHSPAERSMSMKRGPAIADKFEKSTVLFADLAGFTKWSSDRDPVAVFELLETLYHAFDKIADKRGVYKIETIGDCYVAITGCPEAQEDHAPRMVKFARAILLQMRVLKFRFAERLGEGTKDLELRIGLHSGSITAGVLRGKKSRFQLFGDTVNTAARMESNGTPGRIHVSQAVADELEKHGHGRWVEARADKIHAKGKGEMQTYFVAGVSTSSMSRGSSLRGMEIGSGIDDTTARAQGIMMDASEYDETTVRGGSLDTSSNHINEAPGSIMVAADREDEEEDDELMLQIHERLQSRVEQMQSKRKVEI